jgi:hypothetical protein
MTTAQSISVSIDNEQDVANVHNVAWLSVRVLNLPVTAQAWRLDARQRSNVQRSM